MKNSTLGRKPGNDMVKGSGAYGINPRAKTTSQSGDGESFAFNGQMGDGVNRARNPYAGNQWSGHSNDGRLVNKGLGPRTGNASSSPMRVGPPATRDAHVMTIATASAGQPIGAGFHCPSVGNPDKINKGR
jgi:hypothetical protein